MKKKITNKHKGRANKKKEVDYEKIRKLLRSRIDYILNRAQIRMWIAETNLVESLNPEQMELYKIYKQRKEDFFDSASIHYTRNL